MLSQENCKRGVRREIKIDEHYVGPPNMTQGGYISGLMAECLDSDSVEVIMRNPTPMNKALILDTTVPDRVSVYDGNKLLNEARPAELHLTIPDPISFEEAKRASLRQAKDWPFPHCFGCGSARSESDGLHVRAGRVAGHTLVATDWVPYGPAVGARKSEVVSEPFVWAAMECPTAKAMDLEGLRGANELIVLGQMTTKIITLPIVGEEYFIMGWPMERAGRKIVVGGALFDQSGKAMVLSKLIFVTLRPGVSYDSLVGRTA